MLIDLEFSGELEVDMVIMLLSIVISVEFIEELECSLCLIFGLVVYEMENYVLVVELFDIVIMECGGVVDNFKWGRIQVDSYIKFG